MVGVEAVVAGLSAFQSNSKKVTQGFNEMDAGAGKLEKSSASLSSQFTSLGSSVLKFAAIMSGAALAGAGVMAAGIIKAASSGLQLNNAMEQASARIQAFTKDGGKTAEILEMIRVRAANTPFAFQEMATAAANLLPAAKASGKGLEELIGLAEILAASNPAEGLEGAAFSLKEALSGDFVSIVERFNLPRQFINQLKAEGVPALEIVSRALKEMGLDADLVSGLALTAEGRWSTFKDTLQGLAATVTKPIFDTFSNSLGIINDLLTQNSGFLESMASMLAGVVSNAISGIIAKAKELFSAFQSGGTAGLVAALGLTPATTELIGKIVSSITGLAQSIAGVLMPALGGIAGGGILDALNTAIEFANEHFEELKGAILGIGAVLAGAAITTTIAAIGTALAAILSPIGLVIAAAALLGAAWAGNWGDIQGITKATIKFIQKAVDNIIKILQPVIKKVIPELIQIWQILSKKAQEIWPYIQKIITKVMEAIQDIIKSVTKTIQSIWSSHGDEMKSIWSAYWDVVFRILKTTLENILDLIKLTLQVITGDWKGAWDTIKDIASRTWEGIRDNINSVLQIISSIIKATMGDISGQIKAAWDGIKSTISSALSAIQTNITTGWNNIKTTIETAINSIKTAVQNGFSSLQSSISTAMNNVISNVTTAWNNIVNTFKNKATEAVNGAMAAINQLPGKISALAGQLASAAATMMQGLINGIIAKATEVTNAVINTVSGAISSLVSSITSGSLATSLINAGKSILNKVIDGVRSITNLASELVTKVTAGVSSLVTAITSGSLAASLLNAGRSILNKLIDGVKGVTNLASELINKVSDAISNLITSITSGSLFSKLRNAGQSVIDGIIEGMQDNASAIWDMLKEIWDDALGNFMGLIGASSPSKVMMAVGGDIMKGLEIGMASMAPAINAQFQASMLSPVASVAGPALGSSSVVNNTYQFYNGGNNINTQFDEAKLEALIIRTIQKNLP